MGGGRSVIPEDPRRPRRRPAKEQNRGGDTILVVRRAENRHYSAAQTRRRSTAIFAMLVAVGAITLDMIVAFPAGGASASPVSPPFQAVTCPTVTECIAVGGSGSLFVSRNGALTWSTEPVPTTHFLYGISCPTATRCIAVGDAGTVLVSDSDLRTWRQVATDFADPLSSLACVGRVYCIAGSDGGVVLATENAGASWRRLSLGEAVVDGVACSSAVDCVAVTSNSEEDFHTSDGTDWSKSKSGFAPLLSLVPTNGVSCYFHSCVSVGNNGLTARSTDGGATWWFDYPYATVEDLNGVACTKANRCVAVGNGGVILATNDGGQRWTKVASPTLEVLLGVTCRTSSFCLAVGAGGTVISTTDGGTHWVLRSGMPVPTSTVHVLVVGDSFAHTLALYVGRDSSPYGVTLIDGGLDGCGLSRGNLIPGDGQASSLVVLGPCASTGPGWPANYKADIAKYHPDLSLLVLGRWDLYARFIDRRWMSPGQPDYDTYFHHQLLTAIRILTAAGGGVAITTEAYTDSDGLETCAPRPTVVKNCPTESQRVSALDAVAREVVSESKGHVSLINLGQRLSPDGRYTQSVDGVVIRAADEIHISEPGGEWLTPWLVPLLKAAIHSQSGPSA